MAANPTTALSHLKPDELKTLLIRVTAYALWKLGTRSGHSPEMEAEELTQRAIGDTLAERRRWNRERATLEQHLRGAIKSYISHYFDSLAAKARVNHSPDLESLANDATTPEDLLNLQYLTHRIREAVHTEDDPLLHKTWHLLESEGWDLKNDSHYFCQQLGLDTTTGGPDYQRWNRLRNRLRSITQLCVTSEQQSSVGTA
jgi:hypothetical protein